MTSKVLSPELVQVMTELRLGQILHTLAARIGLADGPFFDLCPGPGACHLALRLGRRREPTIRQGP